MSRSRPFPSASPSSTPVHVSPSLSPAAPPLAGWAEAAIWHGFWIVLAAAAILQVVHWLSVRALDPLYAQTFRGFDMHNYWNWAQQIAKGDWLSQQMTGKAPFYYGPLYPYYLAVIFKIFGVQFGAAHIVQAIMGVAPPLLVWASARRLFGRGAALGAGLLAALCSPFLFYTQMLLMEGLLLLIHAGILYALVRGLEGRKWGWAWALAAGMLSAAACWGRGNFLLAIPLLGAVWLLAPPMGWESSVPESADLDAEANADPGADSAKKEQSNRKKNSRFRDRAAWMRGAALAGAFAFGSTLLLGVTFARNLHVAKKAVLTTSNGPILFYIGNAHDSAGVLAYPPSFEALEKKYKTREAVPWGRELARDIAARPGAWARLLLKKTWMFFNSYDIADNVSYYANFRYSPLVGWSPVGWRLLLALGALGIWRARRDWKRQVPLYVYCVGFAISIVAVFVVGRYRLQFLLPMLIWSGAGAAELLNLARARRWSGLAGRIVFAGAACALLAPVYSPGAAMNQSGAKDASPPLIRVNDYMSLANAHSQLGQREKARELYRECAANYPWYPNVFTNLGGMLIEDKQADAARQLLEGYIKIYRGDANLLITYAHACAASGDAAQARKALGEILRADPMNVRARNLLDQLGGGSAKP